MPFLNLHSPISYVRNWCLTNLKSVVSEFSYSVGGILTPLLISGSLQFSRSSSPFTWSSLCWYQEYLVFEIFFHNSVLRLFKTREWCTSICEASPLSVTQVRSCFSRSSLRSDGAPKSRKSCRRAHTLAKLGCTTSTLHCLASRSHVAMQSLP